MAKFWRWIERALQAGWNGGSRHPGVMTDGKFWQIVVDSIKKKGGEKTENQWGVVELQLSTGVTGQYLGIWILTSDQVHTSCWTGQPATRGDSTSIVGLLGGLAPLHSTRSHR